MPSAPHPEGDGGAPRRRWWHVVGKCLLVTALLVGAGIPLLMWLLLGIGPFLIEGEIILFDLPLTFSLAPAGALVALAAVVYEVRFARVLVVAACLFLFFGPLSEFKPGGPLHGGEIVFAVLALGGIAACLLAVPGLLLWRRKPKPPAEPDAPNPWSRPAVYPRGGQSGLK